MDELKLNNESKQKVILAWVKINQTDVDEEYCIDEFKELARAAGAEVVGIVIQNLDMKNPVHYMGIGKLKEIALLVNETDADLLICNDELKGSQLRNIEEIVGCNVIDRTTLILDIFSKRANSNEGKLQVKLAQIEYNMPRLVGLRDYLSRTGGGIGTRGPGEQKLETDRRHLEKEAESVRAKLKLLAKTRETKRKRRLESSFPYVAIVGYTNSGKSTLMNWIIENYNVSEIERDRSVFTKDMLFATLDTTVRKGRFKDKTEFLISDTVGFVSNLPHNLVEAFKGTLEELRDSNLILHVVDISKKQSLNHSKVTLDILEEMDLLDKPIITVYNKIDLLEGDEERFFRPSPDRAYISAKTGQGLEHLMDLIEKHCKKNSEDYRFKFPYSKLNSLDSLMKLYSNAIVEHKDNYVEVKVQIKYEDLYRWEKYLDPEGNIDE